MTSAASCGHRDEPVLERAAVEQDRLALRARAAMRPGRGSRTARRRRAARRAGTPARARAARPRSPRPRRARARPRPRAPPTTRARRRPADRSRSSPPARRRAGRADRARRRPPARSAPSLRPQCRCRPAAKGCAAPKPLRARARSRLRHGATSSRDAVLDRDRKDETAAVVGVLADQVDATGRPRDARRRSRAHRDQRTPSRSTTKTSVSPGPIAPPAPRSP